MSSTVHIGKRSLIVTWLRARYLVQNRQLSYFFLTNNTGEEKGLVLGLINSKFNISYTCFSIYDFLKIYVSIGSHIQRLSSLL